MSVIFHVEKRVIALLAYHIFVTKKKRKPMLHNLVFFSLLYPSDVGRSHIDFLVYLHIILQIQATINDSNFQLADPEYFHFTLGNQPKEHGFINIKLGRQN